MKYVKQFVHANSVYHYGYSGRGIRVALLDSGIAPHLDVVNQIIYFRDYVSKKSYMYDDHGHGTHVAGIICGNGASCGKEYLGMAPDVKLLVFKVLDHRGNGDVSHTLMALDWILNNHKKYDIRILNFSVGYRQTSNIEFQMQLLQKLDRLWDEGVIVITAAGNNGPMEHSITIPGISRNVITVGAFEEYGDGERDFAGYSGRGPTDCCIVKPEILAPGTNITSLSRYGNGYEKKSGTSMAAPIVTGALALALEKRRDISPTEMKILLYDSVDRIEGKKNKFWGILNVDKLIQNI